MRTMRIIPWQLNGQKGYTLVMEWWKNGEVTEDRRYQMEEKEFLGLKQSVLDAPVSIPNREELTKALLTALKDEENHAPGMSNWVDEVDGLKDVCLDGHWDLGKVVDRMIAEFQPKEGK